MSTKTMTATEIGAALARNPTSVECIKLVQACEPRRLELRQRLSEIASSNSPYVPEPPAVIEALQRGGPPAMIELKRQCDLIDVELDMLGRLEPLCYAAADKARVAELRAEIPKVVKRVPALADHLRETLSAYEAAVAALQTALHTIGEFDNASVPYPFDDDQLAELLELRHRVWYPPSFEVPAHIPAFIEGDNTLPSCPPVTNKNARDDIVRAYPRSYALLYETRGTNGAGAVTMRRSPSSLVPAHERPSGSGSSNRAWPRLD